MYDSLDNSLIGVVYSILENRLFKRDNQEDNGRELKTKLHYYEEHPVCGGIRIVFVGRRYHISFYITCCVFFEPSR